MHTPSILILYGTSYGQTERIAQRIAQRLEQLGFATTLVNAKSAPPHLSIADYNGVILGASIIARGHQPAVAEFVRRHSGDLNRRPSAFFSVSASAGSRNPAGVAAAERVRDAFLAEVGWEPGLRASIAGAVNYTRYNLLLRWYMKQASKKGGGSTDTSRDHEYTNWAQVDRFADEFGAKVRGALGTVAATTSAARDTVAPVLAT
jgi:menaquinone-dependent protoporphyrinogen oxidase